MNILYTTEAVVEGGRAGHGRTSDGRLAVELSVPKELGGEGGPGTNPEQLFAVGYAACFHSGLLSVARGRKLDASDSTVTAQVGIGPTGHGGFGLAVTLDLHAPKLSRVDAEDLMRRAHALCPYSNATRGNVDVTLSVGGVTLPQIGGVQVVGKVVDAGSGVSADLRGRKVMAIMIKGAYAQFAVAQTIMTGEWRPERHNQGECCCDASTEPHTRGAQDAPGTPMSRRHRPGSAQLMDYTCANPPSTN